MAKQRKQIVVDRSFQYRISIRAAILPLLTILLVSAVLIYFAIENKKSIDQNDKVINDIVATQDQMIEMFLTTPAFYDSKNETIRSGHKTFKNNIGMLMNIKKKSKAIVKNSRITIYFLIGMTAIQTIIIFTLSIFLTHKISGPIFVMTRYLREIKEGIAPSFRPLRKKDEFKEFYQDFQDAINKLACKEKE